jgi:hypothetical protein
MINKFKQYWTNKNQAETPDSFKKHWKGMAKSEEKGRWITVRGNKIFIGEGENVGNKLKDHFDRFKAKNKKKVDANGNKEKKDEKPKASTTEPKTSTYSQNKITDRKEFKGEQSLSGTYKDIEGRAFDKVHEKEDDILSKYDKEHGHVVNTDEFKHHFKDEGYNGSNAAAVQEPASYLAKRAFSENLKREGKHATFYAGSSGSGKSSAIRNLKQTANLLIKSAVVLDSNLSGASAINKIKEAKDMGKKPVIMFAYRHPHDALQGVISRMFDNPKEGGRLVPTKILANNIIGSWKNVSENIPKEFPGNKVRQYFIDNSVMGGKPKLVSLDEIKKMVKYPEEKELTAEFNQEIEKLYNNKNYAKQKYGQELSRSQYEGLIN